MNINERKAVHTDRMKENRIQHVLEVMAKYGITSEELVNYESITNKQKLAKIHKIQANVKKTYENLKKAREAKRGKQTEG